eukprot:UC1_evm1s755
MGPRVTVVVLTPADVVTLSSDDSTAVREEEECIEEEEEEEEIEDWVPVPVAVPTVVAMVLVVVVVVVDGDAYGSAYSTEISSVSESSDSEYEYSMSEKAAASTTAGQILDASAGQILCEQLGLADIILLNKVDLVGSGEQAALTARLNAVNPAARIVPCERGRVPTDMVQE